MAAGLSIFLADNRNIHFCAPIQSLCEIGKKQLVEGEGVSKLRVILLCQDWKMLRAWILESKADLLVVETV